MDLLEPYILREKITYLPPEVMAAFVDNFQVWLVRGQGVVLG